MKKFNKIMAIWVVFNVGVIAVSAIITLLFCHTPNMIKFREAAISYDYVGLTVENGMVWKGTQVPFVPTVDVPGMWMQTEGFVVPEGKKDFEFPPLSHTYIWLHWLMGCCIVSVMSSFAIFAAVNLFHWLYLFVNFCIGKPNNKSIKVNKRGVVGCVGNAPEYNESPIESHMADPDPYNGAWEHPKPNSLDK